MNTMQNQTTQATPKKLTRPRGEKLKAERVQEKLKAERVQAKLKAEGVQETLRSLPGWRFVQRGQTLYRERKFQDHEVAFAFARFAGALTAGMKQPVAIMLSGSRVLVVLHTRSRNGLSDAVLDIAKSLG